MNKKFVVIASYSLIGSSMNLSKFGWLKNVSPQILLGSNLAGSKMGLLKFGWLKNGAAQICVGSNLGPLKFGLAQIWLLNRSNLFCANMGCNLPANKSNFWFYW